MAIIEGGISGSIADVGVAAAVPLHVTSKPIPYGSLGHYRLGMTTGILPVIGTLGANAEICQFSWTDATRLALITRIEISAVVSTTFFAAGVPVQIDLVKSTAWSSPGTGGTNHTIAAMLKMRTSMGSTLVPSANDIRIATTAALGAGTKTLETLSLGSIVAPGPITASLNGQIIAPGTALYACDMASGEHPITLVYQEGVSVRVVNAPATGTWQAVINICWAEATLF